MANDYNDAVWVPAGQIDCLHCAASLHPVNIDVGDALICKSCRKGMILEYKDDEDWLWAIAEKENKK